MGKSSYWKKLISIILITSMMPIVVFGIYAFVNNRLTLKEKVNLENYNQLEQTVQVSERVLKFVQDYYTLIMLYSDLQIWNQIDPDYSKPDELKSLQESLRGGMAIYDVLKDVSLINITKNWVVSQSGAYTFENFVDNQDFFKLMKNENQIFWNYVPLQKTQANTLIKGNLFLVIKPLLGGQAMRDTVMLVSLSNYHLRRLYLSNTHDFPLLVLDTEGFVVHAGNQTDIGSHYSVLPQYKDLDFSGAAGESGHIETDGVSYNFIRSPITGFLYLSAYDKTHLNAASTAKYDFAMLLCSVLFLTVLCLSAFGTRMMYRPVNKLILKFGNKKYTGKDEFEFIHTSITHLQTQNQSMQLEISHYEPMLEELFLTKLVRHRLTLEQTQEMAQQLGVLSRWNYMCFMALQIDHGQTEIVQQDIQLIETGSLGMKIIPPTHRMKYIILNGKCFMLVGSSNHMLEDFMDEIMEYAKEISEQVSKVLHIQPSIGISSVFQDFNMAQPALEESQNVLLYKFLGESRGETQCSNIAFYDEIEPAKTTRFEYPQGKVTAITAAMENVDLETAVQKLDVVIENIYSHKNHVNVFQYYVMCLMVDLLMVANAGGDLNELMDARESLTEELSRIVSPGDMRRFFIGKIVQPVILLLTKKGGSQSQIADKVVAIIQQHYLEELSIEDCAARLNYHPTYIWRIMRSNLGTTFQEYLIGYRMEMAKKWLVETEQTVAEIAAKLRYNNSQNFIRAFKKCTGTTPGKFREEAEPKTR